MITPSTFHIGAAPGTKGWTGSKLGKVYNLRKGMLEQIKLEYPGIMNNPALFDKVMKSYELQGVKVNAWE